MATNPQPQKPVEKRFMKVRDLIASALAGLWEDRTDIKNSAQYARKLRKQTHQRSKD